MTREEQDKIYQLVRELDIAIDEAIEASEKLGLTFMLLSLHDLALKSHGMLDLARSDMFVDDKPEFACVKVLTPEELEGVEYKVEASPEPAPKNKGDEVKR